MATSIYGWVEINKPGWSAVIEIDELVENGFAAYKIYGIFFGVRGSVSEAIAPQRGLPENIAYRTKRDFEEWGGATYNLSWISWQEIAEIDWQKPIIDYWSAQGRDMEDGTIMFLDRTALNLPVDPDGAALFLEKNDPLLERLKTTLQTIVDKSPGWKLLFAMMKQLSEVYGSEGVRLVVWFDN